MSRSYEVRVMIDKFDKKDEKKLDVLLEGFFHGSSSFFESGDDTYDKSFSTCLCGGESEKDFTARLASVIQAELNVPLTIRMTYTEYDPPFEDYTFQKRKEK